MTPSPIRVLLVDDSPLALHVLSHLLAQDPQIQVVGKAHNGLQALNLIPVVKPTIICTDYFMPKMDGLELTKQVMKTTPMPILVISSILNPKNAKEIFPILEAGALDCIEKPSSVHDEVMAKTFIAKIHSLSKIYVFGKEHKQVSATFFTPSETFKAAHYKIIAIGASTGGTTALATIFKLLPAHFPIPILCVQHISKGFLEGFIDWLKSQCQLNIKIVIDQEEMEPGYIYFPCEGAHLVMNSKKQLSISHTPPIEGHRPSINATMLSVAQYFGSEAIGILLTGMGQDGAQGMKAIATARGLTIAQNEASCTVFGMPKAAIAMEAAKLVMDPLNIAVFLRNLTMK